MQVVERTCNIQLLHNVNDKIHIDLCCNLIEIFAPKAAEIKLYYYNNLNQALHFFIFSKNAYRI